MLRWWRRIVNWRFGGRLDGFGTSWRDMTNCGLDEGLGVVFGVGQLSGAGGVGIVEVKEKFDEFGGSELVGAQAQAVELADEVVALGFKASLGAGQDVVLGKRELGRSGFRFEGFEKSGGGGTNSQFQAGKRNDDVEFFV